MQRNKRGNIKLSQKWEENFLIHDSYTYKISDAPFKPGFNSSVFILEDPNDVFMDRVLKICKFEITTSSQKKKIKRFLREIDALKKAKRNECENIIELFFDGKIKIGNKEYFYYVMEKAECNLKEYMLDNELDISQKLKLCNEISKGIYELHNIGIYHRDIKPENILLLDDVWKIGDLGLISHRDEDFDDPCEKIGPTGWLSPEVMNKVYTENQRTAFKFDCRIDDMSDIFQLGKLFWFIFQGNIPIGQIKQNDFRYENADIFKLIEGMIQYSKGRRLRMQKIQNQFKSLEIIYAS